MPETAGGGRRPVDEADVQAVIDRTGRAPALLEGRRGVPRGRPAHESGAGRPDGCGGSGRREPEVLRLHGAAGSAWRASGGHCSGCDRVVVPVRRRFPFPLPGSRSGPGSRWEHWLRSAVWSSGWPCGTTGRSVRTVVSAFHWKPWLHSAVLPSGRPLGSFSGGTAGRSARTAVMVPWAGTSAGPGSPSSCGPACCLFPGCPLGDVPPGVAAGLVVHLVDVRLRSVCRALSSGVLDS